MKTLLLLHGALGAKDQLKSLANSLEDEFDVQAINFPGHGGEEEPEEFSIPLFADAVLKWLDNTGLKKTDIFGYSMGGYVAMYLAARNPERVGRIVTLGTKYEWNETIAEAETALLNIEKMEAKVPKFVAQLQQRHAPHEWKNVVNKTARMLRQMGAESPLCVGDFENIHSEVLLLLGDRDKMVTLRETTDVFLRLPKAQFGVLPNTPHPLELVDAQLLAFLIKRSLQ